MTPYRYVVVDASARTDTPQALRYYAQDLPHRALFARQPESALVDLGPWLVQLPDVIEASIEPWLRALELGYPAVSWLACEADFEALFDHLEACLDLRRADDRMALLRYWDGRVFARLQRVLAPAQRLALLGPVAQWRIRVHGADLVVERAALREGEAA